MNFQFDEFSYRNRSPILHVLIALIGACLAASIYCCSSKWMNSAGLIADLTGIVQLEVSGVFDAMLKAAINFDEQGMSIPSHYAREIIDVPDDDHSWKSRFDEWLKRSPKAGVSFIALGCVFQLVATWM